MNILRVRYIKWILDQKNKHLEDSHYEMAKKHREGKIFSTVVKEYEEKNLQPPYILAQNRSPFNERVQE